jgi:hypothetical protein
MERRKGHGSASQRPITSGLTRRCRRHPPRLISSRNLTIHRNRRRTRFLLEARATNGRRGVVGSTILWCGSEVVGLDDSGDEIRGASTALC